MIAAATGVLTILGACGGQRDRPAAQGADVTREAPQPDRLHAIIERSIGVEGEAAREIYLEGLCPNATVPRAVSANSTPPFRGYDRCEPLPGDLNNLGLLWLALGQFHFFHGGDIARAIAAFDNAVAIPEFRNRTSALYLRAWSHYRLDDFDAAITDFDRLLTMAPTSELRREAVQYLALSLTSGGPENPAADPWTRAHDYLQRTNGDHRVDVVFAVADVLEAMQACDQLVAAWTFLVARYPDRSSARGIPAKLRAATGSPPRC